jgi:transcriptional regulator with GAF, ATPase, and Fis domain
LGIGAEVSAQLRYAHYPMTFPPSRIWWPKALVLVAGVLVCLYAISVLSYVQSIPDIGLQCAFTPVVNSFDSSYFRSDEPDSLLSSRIVQLGEHRVNTWPEFVRTLLKLREEPVQAVDPPSLQGHTFVRRNDETLVLVQLRQEDGSPAKVWCRLGTPPPTSLVPSILWFFLKFSLFLVGAFVYWKRPSDRSAAQFFFLCIITLGAYMGGYHWSRIVTQPVLLLVFMTCAVLLPAVSLHFYLVFPRRKPFVERRPHATLLAIYALPGSFLALLVLAYLQVRLATRQLMSGQELSPTGVEMALEILKGEIYVYLGVAALLYLASVVCLVHSYRTAAHLTERNQVKWILFAGLAALMPIGYTLYLIGFEPEDFTSGAATWPMFAASVCFTAAFAISITRYRLMQLDQIVSSGMVYFVISGLAGLVYYAVVFLGTLVVGQRVISELSLRQAFLVSTTALVLMVVLDLARSRLKRALDRRFYREKHQLDRTLRRMGQAIEQLVDPPTLARRLMQASAELLGVSRGAVYLREGQPPLYRLAGCLGPIPQLTELPPGCPIVEVLETRGRLQLSDGRWHAGELPIMPSATRQLEFLGGELAHALAHEGQLLALLVLGPKEPGPYTAEDLNLLSAFAQLTALALESAERHDMIEALNQDLQTKVEKISEQQRRILALQSQLMNRGSSLEERGANGEEAAGEDGKPSPSPLDRSGIIGSSPAIRQLLQLVRKVSASEAAVLLRGESGTGKELLAQAVHDASPRAARPFVKVHCAALSAGLLESELFGHVKGAFTSAHRDKVGRFELAHGGTLFLDEIGDISWEVQTKLLRVLQEKTFERVGSSESVKVDVRIIAATHQDLERLIAEKRFRADLFYRLNVIPLAVPPLRERVEDIPELAQHFLRLYAQRCGKAVTQIDDDALAALKGYPWPGNVRELENVLERAVVVAEGAALTVDDLPAEIAAAAEKAAACWEADAVHAARGPTGVAMERADRDRRERERLVRALAVAQGNKAEAARALGLARSTLVSRLKKYGLS